MHSMFHLSLSAFDYRREQFDSTCYRLDSNSPVNSRMENRIVQLRKNDVLLGRGSIIDSHPGNECFRVIVQKHKSSYMNARKNCKEKIALGVIAEVGKLDPPGRFLARGDGEGRYLVVSQKRALDKTMQALRERWRPSWTDPCKNPSVETEPSVQSGKQDVEKMDEAPVADESVVRIGDNPIISPCGPSPSSTPPFEPMPCNIKATNLFFEKQPKLSRLPYADEFGHDDDQFRDADEPTFSTSLAIFQRYASNEYRNRQKGYPRHMV